MKLAFVATVTTAWHLIGLKSYLLKLKEQNPEDIYGCVLLQKHPVNGSLIRDDMLHFAPGIHCRCIREDGTSAIMKELDDHEISVNFQVITPSCPEIIVCKRVREKYGIMPKAVVLDEGVGCYDQSLVRWTKAVYIDTHSISASLHYVLRSYYQKVYQAVHRTPVYNFALFTGKLGALKENTEAIGFYRKYFELEKEKEIPAFEEPYILFFTNPLEEEGNIAGADLQKIYGDVVRTCELCGYRVLFRPHPRETKLEKYAGFEMLKVQASSSEALLNQLTPRPAFVIGAHSTSLITAKIFFGVPGITIGSLLRPYCRTEFCKDLIVKYNHNFQGLVYVPENCEQIKTTLISK